MLPEHRAQLLRVLAALDQLSAKVEEISRGPIERDKLQHVIEVSAIIQDALLQVQAKLNEND